MPAINVNSYYRQLSTNCEDKDVKEYLKKKIRQVEWVHQCISQRHSTIMKVSEEILARQYDFFRYGPGRLKPLKLADVAEALDIHESTVSRAVGRKYLQCSWGIFPMEIFFQRKATSRDTRSAAMEEQSFTPQDIKRELKDIIEKEDRRKPYSNRLLCEKLAERGISISRRTVAKYRDEEGIPGASGRKTYKP